MSALARCGWLLAGALCASAQSAELKLPREGWVAWEVPAVENAPAFCCWQGWDHQNVNRVACKLDTLSGGYGTRDRETTGAVKVYARVAAGKIERLRVLASDCAVETRTPVQPLTDVTVDDSARWLIEQAKSGGVDTGTHDSLGESAITALAMHRGEFAGKALADFAQDPRKEMRKWSVFWLGQVRGEEGAVVVSNAMFNDRDAEVREHAAFSLAQTKLPRAAPDLIRLGNTDKSDHVRAQAWFWLAQTGAAGAEDAIASALRKDSNNHVREQAIFALSQLPDERGTRALITVVEDRSLSSEQRKKAMFWLSQSKSDSAQAYLEKALALR